MLGLLRSAHSYKPRCPSPETLEFPVRPLGPLTPTETPEESPRLPGPSSLFIHGSFCGPSPSFVQVSACVSCPLLSSYCCIPPWYRGPCGGLISCSGCRHPELRTRSRDLPVGSWGVIFSVGAATLVSLLDNHLPIHLTVIRNCKIFGKLCGKEMSTL